MTFCYTRADVALPVGDGAGVEFCILLLGAVTNILSVGGVFQM